MSKIDADTPREPVLTLRLLELGLRTQSGLKVQIETGGCFVARHSDAMRRQARSNGSLGQGHEEMSCNCLQTALVCFGRRVQLDRGAGLRKLGGLQAWPYKPSANCCITLV